MYLDTNMVESKDVKAVYMNEVEMSEVIALDTEEGWIQVYDRDENNLLVVDSKRRLRTKRYYGDITVKWHSKEQ